MKNRKLVLFVCTALLLIIFWPKPAAEFRLITNYDTAEERADSTKSLSAKADSVTTTVLDRFNQIELLITETKDEIQAQQLRIKQLENELVASQNVLEQQRLGLNRERASYHVFHRICWAVLFVGIVFFLLALWLVIFRKKGKEPASFSEPLEKETETPAEEVPTKDAD